MSSTSNSPSPDSAKSSPPSNSLNREDESQSVQLQQEQEHDSTDYHFALKREKRTLSSIQTEEAAAAKAGDAASGTAPHLQQKRRQVSSTETTEFARSSAHVKRVVTYLKPVQESFLNYLEMNASVSQFDVCVNDSQAGHVFEETYDIGETLGEGGFAIVYQCTHKANQRTYAVKELFEDLYEEEGENLKLEIRALKKLSDGPYIVRLLDVFVEPSRTYMVLEEMKGGDLLDRLGDKKVYSEHDARRVTRTLIEAVEYCHKKGFVHRDIKPENILLVNRENDINIKLADFGCAKEITGPNFCHSLVGSPEYVAPEVYIHENGYDQRCDLWSIGVVIYVLLGGYCPFEAPEHELPEVICEGNFKFHPAEWSKISDPPKKLIESLLTVDVAERATIDDALSCEWLRRQDTRQMMGSEHGRRSSFHVWLQKQPFRGSVAPGLSSFADSVSSFALSEADSDSDDDVISTSVEQEEQDKQQEERKEGRQEDNNIDLFYSCHGRQESATAVVDTEVKINKEAQENSDDADANDSSCAISAGTEAIPVTKVDRRCNATEPNVEIDAGKESTSDYKNKPSDSRSPASSIPINSNVISGSNISNQSKKSTQHSNDDNETGDDNGTDYNTETNNNNNSRSSSSTYENESSGARTTSLHQEAAEQQPEQQLRDHTRVSQQQQQEEQQLQHQPFSFTTAERKKIKDLQRKIYDASQSLLDNLFEHLSHLPDPREPRQRRTRKLSQEQRRGQLRQDAQQKSKQQLSSLVSQGGIALPASAIHWLGSHFPSSSLLQEEGQESQYNHSHSDNGSSSSSFANNGASNVATNTFLRPSLRNRVALVKFLLARVTHLRVTADDWPVTEKKIKIKGLKATVSAEEAEISAIQQQQRSTSISNINNGNRNDSGISDDNSLFSYYTSLLELIYRPRIDMNLFPNIQVLWLDQVPPQWIKNLDSTGPKNNLQFIRIRNACLYDLNNFFFPSVVSSQSSSPPPSNKPQLEQHQLTQQEEQANGQLEEHQEDALTSTPRGATSLLLPTYHAITHLKLTHCSIGEMSFQQRYNEHDNNTSNCSIDNNGQLSEPSLSKKNNIPLFSCMPNLKSLCLAHNDIKNSQTVLNETGIKYCSNLNTIDLSYNKLTELHNAHHNIGYIKILKLSHNSITSVEGIDRLVGLEQLYLDYNNIQNIAQITTLMSNLPELNSLKLIGNPLYYNYNNNNSTSSGRYSSVNGSNTIDGDSNVAKTATKKKNKSVKQHVRLMILNMFKEQRLKTLPEGTTYRQLLQVIPVLDDKPISTKELYALRDFWTYDPVKRFYPPNINNNHYHYYCHLNDTSDETKAHLPPSTPISPSVNITTAVVDIVSPMRQKQQVHLNSSYSSCDKFSPRRRRRNKKKAEIIDTIKVSSDIEVSEEPFLSQTSNSNFDFKGQPKLLNNVEANESRALLSWQPKQQQKKRQQQKQQSSQQRGQKNQLRQPLSSPENNSGDGGISSGTTGTKNPQLVPHFAFSVQDVISSLQPSSKKIDERISNRIYYKKKVSPSSSTSLKANTTPATIAEGTTNLENALFNDGINEMESTGNSNGDNDNTDSVNINSATNIVSNMSDTSLHFDDDCKVNVIGISTSTSSNDKFAWPEPISYVPTSDQIKQWNIRRAHVKAQSYIKSAKNDQKKKNNGMEKALLVPGIGYINGSSSDKVDSNEGYNANAVDECATTGKKSVPLGSKSIDGSSTTTYRTSHSEAGIGAAKVGGSYDGEVRSGPEKPAPCHRQDSGRVGKREELASASASASLSASGSFPEYVWGGNMDVDNLSVPSSIGGGGVLGEDDGSRGMPVINTVKYQQFAEEWSKYNGPEFNKKVNILENLESYFRLFVFPPPDIKNNYFDTGNDDNDNDNAKNYLVEEEENPIFKDMMMLIFPRIQLWPVDRKSRDMNTSTAVATTAGNNCVQPSNNNPNREGYNEKFQNVWRDQMVIACGKPALQRLFPNRVPRYGFHGEMNYSSSGKTETVSEPRKIILCLSNTTMYFILGHEHAATKAAQEDDNDSVTENKGFGDNDSTSSCNVRRKKRRERSKKFPAPIAKDATFVDALWPHAVACHPLNELKRITIGFGFQRLTLRFANTTYPSSDDFVYVLITSNKIESVKLLRQVQELAHEAIVKEQLQVVQTSGGEGGLENKDTIKIDNDDRHVLDALAMAVSDKTTDQSAASTSKIRLQEINDDVVILHYQLLQQRWKHGQRGSVKRLCVLTDTKIYLLDEDYIGDGSCHNHRLISNNTERELPLSSDADQQYEELMIQQQKQPQPRHRGLQGQQHISRLGEACFKLVDSAELQQIEQVQAADADPRGITIVIRPASRLSRTHNWRLLCNDGESAEKLVEDVRRATSDIAYTTWF